MISLNITSVTDEIFALTALREAVTGQLPSGRPPVLTADNLPALRVMARMAFSELAMQMSQYLSECAIDPEDVGAQRPFNNREPVMMSLTLANGAEQKLGAGTILTLKRYLEHLVALDVLRRVYLPLDAAAAEGFASEMADKLDGVRSLLAPPPVAFVRPPSRW